MDLFIDKQKELETNNYNNTCILDNIHSPVKKYSNENDEEKEDCKDDKLLPCYIEIINNDLIIYFFDKYNNSISWKIDKGYYLIKIKDTANLYDDKKNKITSNQRSKSNDFYKYSFSENIYLSSDDDDSSNSFITSFNKGYSADNNDYMITERVGQTRIRRRKKRKKKKKKYIEDLNKEQTHNFNVLKLNDDEIRTNPMLMNSEINGLVKTLYIFSDCFFNLKDTLKKNSCIFYMCQREYLYENDFSCDNEVSNIQLVIKIKQSIIPKLRGEVSINYDKFNNLNETNKFLIRQKLKDVSLNISKIYKYNDSIIEDMFYVDAKSQHIEINLENENNKTIFYINPSNHIFQNEIVYSSYSFNANKEPKPSANNWYEINIFTHYFYKKKVYELIENYNNVENTIKDQSSTITDDWHIRRDELNNLDEYKSSSDDKTIEGYSESEYKDDDNTCITSEVEQYNQEKKADISNQNSNVDQNEGKYKFSNILKTIERMRTSTFFSGKFGEDPTKLVYKELIFYDKNKEVFCKYVGNIKNKLYNGKGKLYDKCNSLIYDGGWLNSEKNGKGKLLFKYFNIWYLYEGEFYRDEIVGKGIISLIDKEYVKGIETNKINKLCPLLIKTNFSNKHKNEQKNNKQNEKIKYNQDEPAFDKDLLLQIEKTAMASYSSTNNVDFWTKEIIDIYFPYLKKWDIYSIYCSSNIENIKKKKDIFEANQNNFKNAIGYPSFEFKSGYNETVEEEYQSDSAMDEACRSNSGINMKMEIKNDFENQNFRENEQNDNTKGSSDDEYIPQETKNLTNENFSKFYENKKKWTEEIFYSNNETSKLQKDFFECMKNKNELKLYYPILSKNIGLTKIIYADKSEYFGPINNKGQPNTNEKFPKGFFNNENFFYEGELKNFLPHGYGVLKNKDNNKNTYIGFWKNGYREGTGTLNIKNKKYVIQGNFTKDQIHDNINIYVKDEKISKIQISNINKKFKKMKIFFRNGYIFYGHFCKKYQRNGLGILIDTNNKILYHGYYKNDVIDKFCYILRHKDNTIYCGNLQRGFKKGFGKLYYEEQLKLNDQHEFNLSLSDAKTLARKLEAYDGIDISTNIPFNVPFDSNHTIYIGYWNKNKISHFGSCNLKNGIYKGDISQSKKDGIGIYIYKKKKSNKNKNRYILSYFKKDKIHTMGKYYNEHDKLKVYQFEKEQIKQATDAYHKCFCKQKINPDILKTDKLHINHEYDAYINVTLTDILSSIMSDVFDQSTSFINYLHRPFKFDLNYFLKK
ncbi:conserved Plasmodium protein, unknown function [Plasmodium vinckei]|uniref:MORN repeat protein n=1 Tax=Plasmodium vinckei TaxID=5860 RepID=A0A6V7TD72_PLAVN|nr:conserved Plasmodium protein, unknown function [Plasmodium vinckei]